MKRLLNLLIIFSLLVNSGLFSYAQVNPRIPSVRSVSAAADNTAVRFQKALYEQASLSYISQEKARDLEKQAFALLEKGDLPAFYRTQNALYDTLLGLLRSSLIRDQIYALQMLAAHLREGIFPQAESSEVFAFLRETLYSRQKCSGTECEVLGLSALVLALSSERKYVLALDSEQASASRQTSREKELTAFYLKLLTHDFGSATANNTLASYLLPAVGYTGGAVAVRHAAEILIEQSKRLPLLWGQISIPGGNFYLNRYDVANAPAQKTAMQVLASLGAEGKKALEYFAEENRSLASYVHANIELSYLGSSRIPVEENLQRLYCFQKWQLKSQKDFELKKEIAYAYGKGRELAYVSSEEDRSCRVIVPQTPDPRLVLQEKTQAFMGEVLFNVALLGAGEFVNILLQTHRLALVLKARTASALHRAGKNMAKNTLRRPALRPEIRKISSSAEKPAADRIIAAATESNSAQYTSIKPTASAAPAAPLDDLYLKSRRKVLVEEIELLRGGPSWTDAQKAHLAYLRDKLESKPLRVSDVEETRKGLSTLAQRQQNAFIVFGPQMETYKGTINDLSENFLTRPLGAFQDTPSLYPSVSLSGLVEDIFRYGKTSPDIFIRWSAHGTVKHAGWKSLLSEGQMVGMEDIAAFLQQIIASGYTNTVTLFMDSCYSGMAFKEFLALPAALRQNINFFAPVGRLELNYSVPSAYGFHSLSPLEFARTLWKDLLTSHGVTGQAYVNGKIIRPIDQAIKQANTSHSPLLPQLRVLREVGYAETPEDIRYVYQGLLKSGITVTSQGMNDVGRYIILPREPGISVSHPPAYTLKVSEEVRNAVNEALEHTVW